MTWALFISSFQLGCIFNTSWGLKNINSLTEDGWAVRSLVE